MAKLYFKYGAMGSSKTAQALITKYNYEENGLSVWLIKPSADVRDGADVLRSRIGLEAKVQVIPPQTNIYQVFQAERAECCDVIIVDECQFMLPEQIDQLREIAPHSTRDTWHFKSFNAAATSAVVTPQRSKVVFALNFLMTVSACAVTL